MRRPLRMVTDRRRLPDAARSHADINEQHCGDSTCLCDHSPTGPRALPAAAVACSRLPASDSASIQPRSKLGACTACRRGLCRPSRGSATCREQYLLPTACHLHEFQPTSSAAIATQSWQLQQVPGKLIDQSGPWLQKCRSTHRLTTLTGGRHQSHHQLQRM